MEDINQDFLRSLTLDKTYKTIQVATCTNILNFKRFQARTHVKFVLV